MSISTNSLSKFYDALQYVSIEYYAREESLSIEGVSGEGACFKGCRQKGNVTPGTLSAILSLSISSDDILEIEKLNPSRFHELLNDAKSELTSNLYQIEPSDRSTFIESLKKDFYGICLNVHQFYWAYYIQNKIQFKTGDGEVLTSPIVLYDKYILALSYTASQWAYTLKADGLSITNTRGGIWKKPLRSTTIHKILFDTEEDDVNLLLESPERDNVNIEAYFKEKHYITFSDGALNKFVNGDTLKNDEFIDWKYRGYKKANKTPSQKDLALFCLVTISARKLKDLSKDQNILEYITSSITLDGNFISPSDKSTISKARGIKNAYKITTIEDLIKHLEH
ncbi:hypothetical protein [Parabacteroides sp. PF5-9]|uniref:hypothetical protein n=1 Tax=Parabacteroides sp. PF5-9 TaxID=1742404 RepID=UPI00247621D0|nr:hypothetical protein [Parabacteroides sp. PF5-9]MDH6356234.1 hypothetical protein [Parabacteroides sp. PF5-9]